MARPKPKRPSGAATLQKGKKAPKRRISKQQLILYIISILIILSFALSFVVSGLGGRSSSSVAPPAATHLAP